MWEEGEERETPQHPSLTGHWSVRSGLCLWKGLNSRARIIAGSFIDMVAKKCLICERQLGPAVNCSVVFRLLFFQRIELGPLPLAFSWMLSLELGSELGGGQRWGRSLTRN